MKNVLTTRWRLAGSLSWHRVCNLTLHETRNQTFNFIIYSPNGDVLCALVVSG